jgi:excisionase family DNA binding protein
MPTRQTRRRYASVAEAADYLGLSPKTLRRYIASGRLTAYRVGPRHLRVDLDEVDDKLARPIPTAASDREPA